MITKIMAKLGWVSERQHKVVTALLRMSAAESQADYHRLYTVSQELRQATQELYDQYCPGISYYPLDVALGEYDREVGGV